MSTIITVISSPSDCQPSTAAEFDTGGGDGVGAEGAEKEWGRRERLIMWPVAA